MKRPTEGWQSFLVCPKHKLAILPLALFTIPYFVLCMVFNIAKTPKLTFVGAKKAANLANA